MQEVSVVWGMVRRYGNVLSLLAPAENNAITHFQKAR